MEILLSTCREDGGHARFGRPPDGSAVRRGRRTARARRDLSALRRAWRPSWGSATAPRRPARPWSDSGCPAHAPRPWRPARSPLRKSPLLARRIALEDLLRAEFRAQNPLPLGLIEQKTGELHEPLRAACRQ